MKIPIEMFMEIFLATQTTIEQRNPTLNVDDIHVMNRIMLATVEFLNTNGVEIGTYGVKECTCNRPTCALNALMHQTVNPTFNEALRPTLDTAFRAAAAAQMHELAQMFAANDIEVV